MERTPMEKTRRGLARWLTPAVFLLLIFGFAAAWLLTPDRGFSESENRLLQQRPDFTWEALLDGSFTAGVEAWVTDQFPGRDGFIGVKTQSEYLLGKRDTSGVYFAKDGYLIERHTPESLDREQLLKNAAHLQGFINRAAQELGTEHVRLMLVPTAGEILSEKLPAYAPQFCQRELIEQVYAGIPPACAVELLPSLWEKREEALYYKTDHHWTTLGAFYAYREYCASLGLSGLSQGDFTQLTVSDSFYGTVWSKARLYNTQPDSIVAWLPRQEQSYTLDYNLGERQSDSLYDESYLQKRDKYSYFLGGNNALVTIRGGAENGKKLLLVKDSYAHCFVPFLTNEYEEIHMVDLRYFNMPLSQYMEQNGFTDVLALYNAVTFASDTGVLKIDR